MGKIKHGSVDGKVLFGSKDYQLRYSDNTQGTKRMSSWGVYGQVRSDSGKFSTYYYGGKRHIWIRKYVRSVLFTLFIMGALFLLDSFLFSVFDPMILRSDSTPNKLTNQKNPGFCSLKEKWMTYEDGEKTPVQMYGRLLKLASHSLSERELKQEDSKFWKETYTEASAWKPCADRKSPKSSGTGKSLNSTGFILVSANGGLNQQRVAVCNAVAVASLLNATLVIPRFLFSNVWKDPSQFGDIYQEKHFMNILKDDVDIIKELPPHLMSLEFESTGTLITDADIPKEAKPVDYVNTILPLLLKDRVVHFLGFGNRLGFDPLPSELQRLRCKCNFHALKFVPKIQEVGSLLIRRIRKNDVAKNTLDKQLLGKFISRVPFQGQNAARADPIKYLSLHLRFEVDMVAYSLCKFGGGEEEEIELQAYREVHFPLLVERLKNSMPVSPEELRISGKCPLTPEEAALVLAGLGFKSDSYIYLAGSHIYGAQSRMNPLTTLYPNLVTKEDLLTPTELAPFRNFSSQMAALDFIACAAADVFAITDSGSQLSSLVSGFRSYYGNGHAPTLTPSKKRLATIFLENKTIGWNNFEDRVRKMIEEGQKVHKRGYGRSIYRQPRCPDCMCRTRAVASFL